MFFFLCFFVITLNFRFGFTGGFGFVFLGFGDWEVLVGVGFRLFSQFRGGLVTDRG